MIVGIGSMFKEPLNIRASTKGLPDDLKRQLAGAHRQAYSGVRSWQQAVHYRKLPEPARTILRGRAYASASNSFFFAGNILGAISFNMELQGTETPLRIELDELAAAFLRTSLKLEIKSRRYRNRILRVGARVKGPFIDVTVSEKYL